MLDQLSLTTSYDTLQKLAVDANARLVQCQEKLLLAMSVREVDDLTLTVPCCKAAKQPFTAAYLRQLTALQWAELVSLHLSHSGLGAEDTAVIVKASLPKLRTLNLSHNRLDGAAMMLLALGEWPKLMRLDLYHNDFESTGVDYLRYAYWPELLWVNVSQDATYAQFYALSCVAAFLPVSVPGNKTIKYCIGGVVLQADLNKKYQECSTVCIPEANIDLRMRLPHGCLSLQHAKQCTAVDQLLHVLASAASVVTDGADRVCARLLVSCVTVIAATLLHLVSYASGSRCFSQVRRTLAKP